MKYSMIFSLLFLNSLYVEAKDELNPLYDKNLDGIRDVSYKYFKDGSSIELHDSNYDTKIDSQCLYDSNNVLSYCVYDQDYDAYYETFVKYDGGQTVREVVDSNKNKYFDIAFYFIGGSLIDGVKYYSEPNEAKTIGRTKFKFNYPLSEKRNQTDMSELEFSNTHEIKEFNSPYLKLRFFDHSFFGDEEDKLELEPIEEKNNK